MRWLLSHARDLFALSLALVLRSGNQFQRRAAAMVIALLNPQAMVPNIKSKTSAIDI